MANANYYHLQPAMQSPETFNVCFGDQVVARDLPLYQALNEIARLQALQSEQVQCPGDSCQVTVTPSPGQFNVSRTGLCLDGKLCTQTVGSASELNTTDKSQVDYSEKDLISFDNYLLAPQRRKLYEDHPGLPLADLQYRLETVSHADLENWRGPAPVDKPADKVSSGPTDLSDWTQVFHHRYFDLSPGKDLNRIILHPGASISIQNVCSEPVVFHADLNLRKVDSASEDFNPSCGDTVWFFHFSGLRKGTINVIREMSPRSVYSIALSCGIKCNYYKKHLYPTREAAIASLNKQ